MIENVSDALAVIVLAAMPCGVIFYTVNHALSKRKKRKKYRQVNTIVNGSRLSETGGIYVFTSN